MQTLIKNSRNLINSVNLRNKRYLYEEIDFSEKMIGILGQRGVGKTTLMLQYLKLERSSSDAIYLSADDMYFLENSLKEIVEELYFDYGIRVFCIDEVHKYKNWNQELKNIYDLLPEAWIIFSGSSSLNVSQGAYDLSRRAVVHTLSGLSFREFIAFKTGEVFQPVRISELLVNYKKYSNKISSRVDVLDLFEEYLEAGYYPYFLEGKKKYYYAKLENALNKTVYEDIANLNSIKTEHLYLFRRILNFLATSTPGEINVNRLSSALGVAFETTENYMDILYQISLARFLLKNQKGSKLIRKTDKVFLDNTNLNLLITNKLGRDSNRGSLRELFVLNQLQNAGVKVFSAGGKGDFVVRSDNKKYFLEIGGKNKKFTQISGIPDSFLVLDNMEIAESGKIPLYLFGFLC